MNSIPRRSALAAAGSLLIVKPETAFSYQANSKIGVAIIGTGGRGRYDGAYFAKDPRVQIVALCDLYPDAIDKAKTEIPAASSAKTYKDYKELLGQSGVDAVLITTPIYLHPEHFEAAVNANKHIYCEKSAGASVTGVKRLQAAAKRSDPSKVIFFGFQQRWSPEYLAADKLIHSAEFGELNLMRSEWMVGGIWLKGKPRSEYFNPAEEARAWYPWRAKSGDFIVEQDCHGIDVMNWYARAHPTSAIGGGSKGRRALGDCTDAVSVTYFYPGNLCGFLNGTQLAQGWGDVREQFFGANGTVTTTRKYYEWFKPPATGDRVRPVRVESKREITIDAIEQFLNSIQQGKQANMAFDACDSTFTALLGRMAVDAQRTVTWEEMLQSE